MYLKALEIQGFKSFPDKTALTFGSDITAIVGPNGSGKSNISDALRWVMGEQSTRTLRGGKMEDVIFGGTARRKQTGFAEVSLVLDNTGGLFAMEESEIMVTRRYYRSGESEYYINRRSVRLRDVNELFMDTGLGREGYSIIGQGKIDEILSVKSADRREIFEEAAGISRFRHRKEEAERKLLRTAENLLRIGDKIDELALQVEPLRVQAEKARRFLILRDELRGLEVSLWLEQLERIRISALKTRTDYEHAVRQKEAAQAEVDRLYAAAETYGAQMREKDVEIEGIRFELMRGEADANGLERARAVLKNKIQNNLENENRMQAELDRQEGRAGNLAAQIAERRARLAAILQETQTIQMHAAEREDASHQAAGVVGALEAEVEALRGKETVESASATEARNLLSALAAAAQELLDRDEAVRQELATGEDQLKNAEQEHSAETAARNEAQEHRNALQNVIGGYTLRVENRRKKNEQAEERSVKLRMEENALQARIHMLTEMEKLYEGYSKAVKLVMGERHLRGIRGPVAGLLHVPEQYSVAIELALGGAMQHIVVDSEEDGKAAILHLKRRDAGRATFLPLTAIRPGEWKERGVTEEPGFVGMGDALIQFDPVYAKVFSNLLGRVVVVEDLDAAVAMARKYGHRFRIVTLDGQVLNPGGSMTGGSVSKSAGILSRANELERLNGEMQAVRVDLDAAVRAAEETKRETATAVYELELAQAQQRGYEDEVLKLDERCAQLRVQRDDLAHRRDALRAELEQLSARSAQLESDTARARARIEMLEGTAAALRATAEAKQQGKAEAQARIAAMGAEIADCNMQLAALDAERLAGEQALSELEGLRQDITGDHAERLSLIAQFQAATQALSAEILEQENQLQRIHAQAEEKQAAMGHLSDEKMALEANRNCADRDSRDKNTELLQMERETARLEQLKNTATSEEQQLLDKLWETYELSHEAARAQRLPLESTQQATRRIAELKREISELGNINLDAVEAFQKINERYTYLTDQRDDVQSAKRELEQIIGKMTGEMKSIFAEEFAAINASFGETFAALFGGGTARLELEDAHDILNCGIEIKVQPPGKALKIISLLSGGEKAFVAIALYFSILKVRPTPFCVMDEIEAALDDPNVERFARYLRNMSRKTQFIVITHRRGTMEEADVLYGVTMQEQGISKLLTLHLDEMAGLLPDAPA